MDPLIEIISKWLCVPREKLHEGYDLVKEGGMDSLLAVELLYDVEQEFGVTLDGSSFGKPMATVGDLRREIAKASRDSEAETGEPIA